MPQQMPDIVGAEGAAQTELQIAIHCCVDASDQCVVTALL
jgi:hypothetical protein